MTRAFQWYYDGVAKGTGPTQVIGAGETDRDLWECRTGVQYGAEGVAALFGFGQVPRNAAVGAQSAISAAATVVRMTLTPTADGELSLDVAGDFTIAATSPAPYIGGPYSVDLSAEGGGLNLNSGRIEAAPAGYFLPGIAVSVDADTSGGASSGDTVVYVPGLWVYNQAFASTAQVGYELLRNGVVVPGATSPYAVQAADRGATLRWRETKSGAGITRTMQSAPLSVAAGPVVERAAAVVAVATVAAGAASGWEIVVGDGFATILSFPPVPTSPSWQITPTDGGANIDSYPGKV